MADRHALSSNQMFIYIALSLLLPVNESVAKSYEDGRNFPNDERRTTREYHLRQGALRGLILKPSRVYDLQNVEVFLGIPYAAPPVGGLRFMPPVSAPPWPGIKMATRFAPVCPQALPQIKKGNPPSLGRQNYMKRLRPFLAQESEDCLYLNIYVPFREQKSKKFPVLVFIHGDSFEWSSGNSYDGKVLASYGNIMVVTVNFRLGILGFMKPSLTEHVYGNNGLLDQLAALQWIKDNIEDLNGDPNSVTLMGHGTGAACISYLMLSPISNGLFHRAILMSGSALSDWAMTKDPTQYTLQVAQSLGCNPSSKNMMACLQNKPLSEIKKVQILARDFETPLGPVVAGSFIPNEPEKTMESFPNLLSKYQLLSGVTEFERYHDFGVIELDHGILENQRDEFVTKLNKIIFDSAEDVALKEILKQYSQTKLDPQRWNVETNREVILNLFSDARTLAPMIQFSNYHAKSNQQSYFYVFGHNSVSTDYAPLNKSVHGEELPYVLGVPLGGTNTHFHPDYTQKEKLLSEVMMRLWTNFVKIGTPNTQTVNEYYTLDKKHWNHYNVEWPEYDVNHQSFVKLDIPPYISSLYRSNFTNFWIETLPSKMQKFAVDPLFEYTPAPKSKPVQKKIDIVRKTWTPQVVNQPHYNSPAYGRVRPYSPPEHRPDTEIIYRQIQSIKTPTRPVPPGLMEKATVHITTTTTTEKAKPGYNIPVKTSSATITLIISLGILFLAVNAGIFSILYFKKRKLRLRERTLECSRQSRAEIGDVDSGHTKNTKDDKNALQTIKNGYSVIRSMSITKMRGSKKGNKKFDVCKTPKSDDSGGFRERFQLRRHLSTSTLDAHTKVRDWITNEVMHRCSPNLTRKSNSEISSDKHTSVAKPFTRSEELLSDVKTCKKNTVPISDGLKTNVRSSKKYSSNKTKTSEKTTSTSALGSHSSIGSTKISSYMKQDGKSNDSLKSKGTESIQSKKVSVAVDATPAARTNSILIQEPIEISKSLELIENKHSKHENFLQRSKTEDFSKKDMVGSTEKSTNTKTFTNEVTFSLTQNNPLKISHKHSSSDPVTETNYDKLMLGKSDALNILPPVTFRNDVNVTSRDENIHLQSLTAAEALLTIKRRNFPKVLPDLPKAQKRLSLQSTTLQSFRGYKANFDHQLEKPKLPPQPPPRTTTLDRRLAYRNSKPMSSFDTKNLTNCLETNKSSQNYENIETYSVQQNRPRDEKSKILEPIAVRERETPKVIIASVDIPSSSEPTILIKSSPCQVQIPSNVPRVRLPDDFHSQTTGSITSFSSFCSDDEDDVDIDFFDDLAEDKLIQELVGGVESPTNMEDELDTKGPDMSYVKKLEVVPVRINPIHTPAAKSGENYVCISDLLLPDATNFEKTAKIKPNFSLNKMQCRSESLHRPMEKTVKVKQKRTMNPTTLMNRSFKGSKRSSEKNIKSDSSKLEHSNSGSSNDTETSTGTVKMIEIKKNG